MSCSPMALSHLWYLLFTEWLATPCASAPYDAFNVPPEVFLRKIMDLSHHETHKHHESLQIAYHHNIPESQLIRDYVIIITN